MDLGEIRIQRHRFGELVPRSGKIGDVHLGTAQHQVRLRGVSVTQNAVNQNLPLLDLLISDVSCPQHVRDGEIVRMRLALRFENANYFLLLPHAQIAIAKQEHGLMIVGVLRVNSDQQVRRFGDAAHFVVCQRQIEPGSGMRRRLLQSDLVLHDRLLKAAQTSQCSAQV